MHCMFDTFPSQMVNTYRKKNTEDKEVSPNFPENSLMWKTSFPDNIGKSVFCRVLHMLSVLMNCSVLLSSLTGIMVAF